MGAGWLLNRPQPPSSRAYEEDAGGRSSFCGTPQVSQYAALMRSSSRSMSSIADGGSAPFNSFKTAAARSQTSSRSSSTSRFGSSKNLAAPAGLYQDVSLGTSGCPVGNGMVDRIADGRSSGLQAHSDRMYARRQLGIGNR